MQTKKGQRAPFFCLRGLEPDHSLLQLLVTFNRQYNVPKSVFRKEHIIKNCSPKWRWIVVDINRAEMQWGNIHHFHRRWCWIIAFVHTTQVQKRSFFLSIYRKMVRNLTLDARFCLIGCSEVNSIRYSPVEVNSIRYSPPNKPINAHEKHYSIVSYIPRKIFKEKIDGNVL